MTYPNAHLMLSIHWGYGASTSEKAQTSLRFDSTTPASATLVQNAAAAVSTFWSTATALVDHIYKLEFLRLASIGTDGKYVPGTIAYDWIYSGSVPGGGSGGTDLYKFPLQVSAVSSLLTGLARGQAHKGRLYLPYITSNIQTNWNWQSADITTRSTAVAQMITTLNTVMPGPASVFSKGTKAQPTVGAKHAITQVVTGGKPDTQRRRAKQAAEILSAAANV